MGKIDPVKFFKSKGFFVLMTLFIFILVLAFFFGEGGFFEIIRSRSRIEELKKSISQLEKERDALLQEIEELKKNPLALEKKAREKLWLMKKNEKVVVLVKKNDKDGPTATGPQVEKTPRHEDKQRF